MLARFPDGSFLQPGGRGLTCSSRRCLKALDRAEERGVSAQLLGGQVNPLVLDQEAPQAT